MAGQQVACPQCAQILTVPGVESQTNLSNPVAPARSPKRKLVFGLLIAATCIALAVGSFLLVPGLSKTRLGKVLHPSSGRPALSYEKDVTPLLDEYCYKCHGKGKHKGDLALDNYKNTADILRDRKRWELVMHHLRTHEMPPEDKPQPTDAQRELLIGWIESEIFKTDCEHPDPGRVTIRRLNRAEYNNTVRDLVGVDFQPADDFPADDSGYGFDNIGDVLSLPPILLEKYLAAAEKILQEAIVVPEQVKSEKKTFPVSMLEIGYNSKRMGNGWVALNSTEEDDVALKYSVPQSAEYIFRARAYAQADSSVPMKLSFRLDNREVALLDVTTSKSAPKMYEARIKVDEGKRRFSVVVSKLKSATDPSRNDRQSGTVFVENLELEGPFNALPKALPETHKRIFTRQPTPETRMECAREIVSHFAKRAYRRPATQAELDRLMKLFSLADKNGERFERSIQVTLEAVLVSPHFLFRGEVQPDPDNPGSVHLVDEYALASRLSYFLWSSCPDDELFALAEKKALRKNLEAQVKRMLKDPRSHALVENFAGQWLQIRNLKLVTPDYFQYPEFDEELRSSMQRETEMFFESILREDRTVLDFIDADYTYVNERLARHYGLTNFKGEGFQKVSLKGTPRRGLLTQGSVLTLTSNPTRTSPVKRGKWVLENILGTPPPPPPPEVPELSEAKEKVLSGTLRQRMEQHRENPICASCHARMDPIGFGLENFNGIGEWRNQDGKFKIEPAGKLVSGEAFNGPGDLAGILVQKKKGDFVRCLSEKMLTYALGRGMEYYDKCAVDQISAGVAKQNYRFSSVILEVVKSVPFQKRRGETVSSENKVIAQAGAGN